MSTWWSRLKALTRRLAAGENADRALDEEIQAYLREDIDARIRSGDSLEEARRAALAELGGVEQVKESVRDVRTGAWLDALLQDVRYGVRTLVKTPDYSLAVVGSLSLGIASVIAAVAFANGITFRPFPGVRDQRELVEIRIEECSRSHSGCIPMDTRHDDYLALRESGDGSAGNRGEHRHARRRGASGRAATLRIAGDRELFRRARHDGCGRTDLRTRGSNPRSRGRRGHRASALDPRVRGRSRRSRPCHPCRRPGRRHHRRGARGIRRGRSADRPLGARRLAAGGARGPRRQRHFDLRRPADGRPLLPLHRAAGEGKQSRTGQGAGRSRRSAHSGPQRHSPARQGRGVGRFACTLSTSSRRSSHSCSPCRPSCSSSPA